MQELRNPTSRASFETAVDADAEKNQSGSAYFAYIVDGRSTQYRIAMNAV